MGRLVVADRDTGVARLRRVRGTGAALLPRHCRRCLIFVEDQTFGYFSCVAKLHLDCGFACFVMCEYPSWILQIQLLVEVDGNKGKEKPHTCLKIKLKRNNCSKERPQNSIKERTKWVTVIFTTNDCFRQYVWWTFEWVNKNRCTVGENLSGKQWSNNILKILFNCMSKYARVTLKLCFNHEFAYFVLQLFCSGLTNISPFLCYYIVFLLLRSSFF